MSGRYVGISLCLASVVTFGLADFARAQSGPGQINRNN